MGVARFSGMGVARSCEDAADMGGDSLRHFFVFLMLSYSIVVHGGTLPTEPGKAIHHVTLL